MAVDINQAVTPIIMGAMSKDSIRSTEARNQRIVQKALNAQKRAAEILGTKLNEKVKNKIALHMNSKYGKDWETDIGMYEEWHKLNPNITVDKYAEMLGNPELAVKLNDYINMRGKYRTGMNNLSYRLGAYSNYLGLDDKDLNRISDDMTKKFDSSFISDKDIITEEAANNSRDLLFNSAAYSESGLKKAPRSAAKAEKYLNDIAASLGGDVTGRKNNLTGGLK